MKFGSVPIADAAGGTAVHSIRQGDFILKKGTLIGPAEVAALKAAGVWAGMWAGVSDGLGHRRNMSGI